MRPSRAAEACVATRFRNCVTAAQAGVSVAIAATRASSSSLGLKSVFFCSARQREIQARAASRVRFMIVEILVSSVARLFVVAFSISRRIVRLGFASGSRTVWVEVWRRWRIEMAVRRELRWVKSGGDLVMDSWVAAWSEALRIISQTFF